jgi:hypothetical protein
VISSQILPGAPVAFKLGLLLGLPSASFFGWPCSFAIPCVRVGLLALPLCGAALTFFAAAKKVSKESRSNR